MKPRSSFLSLAALTLAILTLPSPAHAADTDIIGKARVIDGDTLVIGAMGARAT